MRHGRFVRRGHEGERAVGVARIGERAMEWLGRRQGPMGRLAHRAALAGLAKLNASAFSRNVSVMLFGTVLGQSVSVLLSPALTRLFTPDQFGALGVYTSVLNILAPASALRYEIPMATARSGEEVANLSVVAALALALTTAALAAASFAVPLPVLDRVGLGALDGYRALLPLGFAMIGAYFVTSYFATWARDIAAISRTRISQGLSGPVSQIVLGLLGMGAPGLAIGFVIGQSAGTALLFRRMLTQKLASWRTVSARGMAQVAWRYRAFPLVSAWSGIVDAAGSGQVVYILVAEYYSSHIAGFMFLAERVVARPLTMISTSLLTVFMAEVRQTMHTDPARLRRRFIQVTSRQFMIGAAWVLVIDVAALFVFPAVFGGQWAEAVPYLLALSLAYLMNSVTAAVGHTLQVLERQALAAAWQVGRVVAVVVDFRLCARYGLSAIWAISFYTAIQLFACCLLLVLMLGSINRLRPRVPEEAL